MADDIYYQRDDLRPFAERCDAAAGWLTYEADHAAEVLPERAGGDRVDPQQWAADKRAAAAAARQYAAQLRVEADRMADGDQVSDERVRQADLVATAAECGGSLVDDRRLTAAACENPFHSPETRQAIQDHSRQRREAIQRSGLFTHVTEHDQASFWQLAAATAERTDATDRHPTTAPALVSERTGPAGARVDDDTDGM